MGFWTLRSSRSVNRSISESFASTQAREDATGIHDVIRKRRQELDELEAKSQGFLADVAAHFSNSGLAGYLTSRYKVFTKYEPEAEERAIGVKWVVVADDLHHVYSFSLIEKDGRVRVDYSGTVLPENDPNGAYVSRHDSLDGQSTASINYTDKMTSTRKYNSYEEWLANGQKAPAWFTTVLLKEIKPL